MGEKVTRRSNPDPSKRPTLSQPTSVKSSVSSLLLPTALFLGFLLGTFFGRPLFISPASEPSSESSPFLQPPNSSDSTQKRPTNPASQIASSGKKEKSWDEKTIQSFSLSEIRTRLSQLSTWSPGPVADQVERWLIKRWVTLESAAACQYAYTAVLQGAEEGLLMDALAIWANAKPSEAARWAGNLGSPSLRDSAIRTVYAIWAKKDSSAAAQSISSLRPASARGIASAATAPPHAGRNFASAMLWARALPGPLREKTLDAILGEWTRRDPAGAASWLIGQPGDVQWALIAKLAADWVRKDPSSALSWGLGQSTEISLGSKLAVGPIQRKFFEAALGALIGTDPQGAANWLASPTGQPFFTNRIGQVAGRWTSMDPQEAVNWSLSLTKEADRDSAIRAVATTWARTDPQAAGQWVRSLTDPSLRDTALNSYCGSLSPYDAASAAQWAVEITSPNLRNGAVESAATRWMQYDPAAARQFILSTPALNQASKERLLR
jgi:hypothetical protein